MKQILNFCLLLILAITFSVPLSIQLSAQQNQRLLPRRIAFLVGVSDYADDSFEDLKFADNDAQALAQRLTSLGFEVTLVTGDEATAAGLREKLNGFFAEAATLESDEIALLMFSGHGQQLRTVDVKNGVRTSAETPFFCPVDAVVADGKTKSFRAKTVEQIEQDLNLLSLNFVIRNIDEQSNSLRNLMIVDACRNNPAKGKAAGVTGTSATVPRGISLLFAAKSGQKSWESADPKIEHGVLTHFLLQGLGDYQSPAANSRGQITWSRLADYIREEVEFAGPELAGGPERKQNPQLILNDDQLIVINQEAGFSTNDLNPNLAWTRPIGSQTYAKPAVGDGKVFIATDNYIFGDPNSSRKPDAKPQRYLPEIEDDQGLMLCFDDATGEFLWQLTRPRLASGRVNDYPRVGIVSQPAVEGKRLWVITNRCELMCLDTEGFKDGSNDGSVTDEERQGPGDADVIWSLDMIEELGVFPYMKAVGNPLVLGDMVYINTSNGIDEKRLEVPSPRAPSFLAVNKNTGEIVWESSAPLDNIMIASWASPSYGVVNGKTQIYFGGGDGWLYAFDAESGDLIWKCDLNLKSASWPDGGRHGVFAAPVFWENSVIIGAGEHYDFADGPAFIWRIDATKAGDVSAELGETGSPGKPNPNSGIIWKFGGSRPPNEKELQDFDEEIAEIVSSLKKMNELLEQQKEKKTEGFKSYRDHSPADRLRMDLKRKKSKRDERIVILNPVIADVAVNGSFVFAANQEGFVECLDVKTGKRMWEYDMLSGTMASPVLFQDQLLVANEDGLLLMMKATGEAPKPIEFPSRNYAMYQSSPVVVGNRVYIASANRLYKFQFAHLPDE